MEHITHNKKEEGVTLLLVLLIVSTLVLISTAVAYLATNEMRASRAVTLSEPAMRAAESGAEESIWYLYNNQGASIPDCDLDNTYAYTTLSNSAKAGICKSYGSADFNLLANQTQDLYLYDPASINGDVDLSGFPITSVTVMHTTGSFSATVTITRIDGTAVTSQVVSPGNTIVLNTPLVAAGTEGRMKVSLLSAGNATLNITTNQGMPSYTTITAVGCASSSSFQDCTNIPGEGYVRRYSVTVPQ